MSSNNFSSLVGEINDLFIQLDKITCNNKMEESILLNEEKEEKDYSKLLDSDDIYSSGRIGNLKSLELRARLGLFDINEVGFVKSLKRKK